MVNDLAYRVRVCGTCRALRPFSVDNAVLLYDSVRRAVCLFTVRKPFDVNDDPFSLNWHSFSFFDRRRSIIDDGLRKTYLPEQ